MRCTFVLCLILLSLAAQAELAFAAGSCSPTRQASVSLLAVGNGDVVLASVGKEVITLDALRDSLGSAHSDAMEERAGKINLKDAMDRLITSKLFVIEAENMSLDEDPEIATSIERFSHRLSREILKRQFSAKAVADPAEVQRIYDGLSLRWTIQTLLFKDKKAADAFAKSLRSGKAFNPLAEAALKKKAASGATETLVVAPKDVAAPIRQALLSLGKAGIVGPIAMADGFNVTKLLSVARSENDELLQASKDHALKLAQMKYTNSVIHELIRKEFTVNDGLVKSLDYERDDVDIVALASDQRVLATGKSGIKITVGELTDALQAKYFHGVARAASKKSGNVNSAKLDELDSLMAKTVLDLEAKRVGITKDPIFLREAAAYRDNSLFGALVNKAIIPTLKVSNDQIEAHYKEHKDELTSPEMLLLDGLVFDTKAAANDALSKLGRGSEITWVRDTVGHSVELSDPRVANFSKVPLIRTKLPAGLQEALSGAKQGDWRFWAGPENLYYVVAIQKVYPASTKPLSEVQQSISKELFAKELATTIDSWSAKLRKAIPVVDCGVKVEL